MMEYRSLKRSREDSKSIEPSSSSHEKLKRMRRENRLPMRDTESSQRRKQEIDDRSKKAAIDFLTLEERKNYQSGTKKASNEMTQKEVLALLLYEMAEYRINIYDSKVEDIKESFIGMRKKPLYKEIYGNEGYGSQQQKEIIVIADSSEDGKKSPKQKQSSESPSSEGEKRRSDQAQEDASLSKRQRSDVDLNQHQLHEQQQRKGKELDPMEAYNKAGPNDELEKLEKNIDQEKGKHEQIKKQIEEKRKEIEEIEKKYLNIKFSNLKKEALMLLKIDIKDIDMITELSKKINHQQKYLEFSQKFLIPYYEKQREKMLSMRHEASNQTGTSRQTDAPPDGTEEREPNQAEASNYQRQDSLETFIKALLASTQNEANTEHGGTSRQAGTLLDDTQQTELNQTEASNYQRQNSFEAFQALLAAIEAESDNEQRVISRQPDASSSSQSLPEIQQPFAAYHPAEAQCESTSQQPNVRQQDQIGQRQDTMVQQHEGHNQADPSHQGDISEDKKERIKNVIDHIMNITDKMHRIHINKMLSDNELYDARYAAVALEHLKGEWSRYSSHSRYSNLLAILNDLKITRS